MFDHIWDCEIDHPVFRDTVGDLMSAVIQAHYNSAQPEQECEKCIFKPFKQFQPEQQWIPVSERLPEKNGVYIVSYEDAVTWLEWFNGKWFFYPSNPAREETGTIIAWMPLPECYRGES